MFSLKIATLCHSVLSCFSPLCLSFHVSLVARLKLTFWPPEPNRKTCGSFPSLPTNITLLTHSFPQSDITFLRSESSPLAHLLPSDVKGITRPRLRPLRACSPVRTLALAHTRMSTRILLPDSN